MFNPLSGDREREDPAVCAVPSPPPLPSHECWGVTSQPGEEVTVLPLWGTYLSAVPMLRDDVTDTWGAL